MRYRFACLALAWTIAASGPAMGQGVAVQLPTYSYFSTNSTVVVPDSVLPAGVCEAF